MRNEDGLIYPTGLDAKEGLRHPVLMTKAAAILNQAMELNSSDRARLAQKLVLSLDGELDVGAEPAWSAEIQRRSDALHAGHARLRDAKEAVKRVRAKLDLKPLK